MRPDGFASVYPRDYETFARNHPEAVKPFQGGKAMARVEPLEFTLDKSICPYRLAYDFVLQPYPCFTSRFLLSRLPAYLVAPEVRYLTHGRYLDPQRNPVDPAVEQSWSRVAHSFPFLNESEKAEQRYFGLFIDSGKFYSSSAAYKEGIPVSEMIHSGNYYLGEDENNRKRVQVLFAEYFGTEVYWSLVDMIHPKEDDDVGLLRKKNCQCCPHCETCFFRFNDDRPDKEDLDLPLIDLSRSVSAGSGENAEWPAPSAPFEPF